MFHVKHSREYELVIRKSRFLSQALFVSSRQDAMDAVARAQTAHPYSNHVCYAYRIVDGSREDVGCSDDGEPHGTAGRPLLALLKYEDIGNAVIPVVRYFGGTRLGTGGLVRAYTDAGKGALTAATLEHYVARVTGELRMPYALHDVLMALMPQYNVRVVRESYTTVVTLRCEVELAMWDAWVQAIRDVSSGAVEPRCLDDAAV